MSDFDYKEAFTEVMSLLDGSSYAQMSQVSIESQKHFTTEICGNEWDKEIEDEALFQKSMHMGLPEGRTSFFVDED